MKSGDDAIKARAWLYYKLLPVCIELLEAVTDTRFDVGGVVIVA